MLPLSICIITKNEEKHIKDCLMALKPLTEQGAELIVTDTGSTDTTKAIAQTFTPHVYSFTWCDDFSAARNFCAKKATNDLIFAVDSDELLQFPENDSIVESMLHSFSSALSQLLIDSAPCGMVTRINPCKTAAKESVMTEKIARIYDKRYYHYEGIIHEQLFPLNGSAPKYIALPLTLYHNGYNNTAVTAEKAERNLALLKKAYAKNPTDVYTLFQIGQTLRMLNRMPEALDYFNQALALDVNPELDYVGTLVESYGYTLLDLGQKETALNLYGVYDAFAHRADFVFLMGMIAMNNGLFEKAIEELKKAVTIPLHSVEGVNSYSAYYNIGVIYECTGHIDEAIAYYQKCGDFPQALNRLTALRAK